MSDAVYPKLVRGDRDHKGCLWGVSAGRAQGDVCGALNVLEHVTHEICALDSALIPPQNTAHLCPRRLPGRLRCEAPSPGSILTCGGRGTGCACSALPVSPLFPGSSPPDVFFIKELVSFEANTGEWSPCSHRACLVLISGALGQMSTARRHQGHQGLQGQGLPPRAGQVAPTRVSHLKCDSLANPMGSTFKAYPGLHFSPLPCRQPPPPTPAGGSVSCSHATQPLCPLTSAATPDPHPPQLKCHVGSHLTRAFLSPFLLPPARCLRRHIASQAHPASEPWHVLFSPSWSTFCIPTPFRSPKYHLKEAP